VFCERTFALQREQAEKGKQILDVAPTPGKISEYNHIKIG